MLRNQEEEMASKVGPPAGCGYDPSKSYEMETNSIFARICLHCTPAPKKNKINPETES